MTVSLEHAMKLFTSWRDTSAKIQVSFSGGAALPDNPSLVRANVAGTHFIIEGINKSLPGVIYVQGDDCSIEVDLRGSVLELHDPKLTKFGGETFSSQLEATLVATLPNREIVSFLVFRRPS